jgi:hypothetical protein
LDCRKDKIVLLNTLERLLDRSAWFVHHHSFRCLSRLNSCHLTTRREHCRNRHCRLD